MALGAGLGFRARVDRVTHAEVRPVHLRIKSILFIMAGSTVAWNMARRAGIRILLRQFSMPRFPVLEVRFRLKGARIRVAESALLTPGDGDFSQVAAVADTLSRLKQLLFYLAAHGAGFFRLDGERVAIGTAHAK